MEENKEMDTMEYEDLQQELNDENKEPNKLLDILSGIKTKVVEIASDAKEAAIMEYNSDPKLYHGMALGAGSVLLGMLFAKMQIKNGLKKHSYLEINKNKKGNVVMQFGYLGRRGQKHKFLNVNGTPEDMKEIALRLNGVADGNLDSAIHF